MSRCGAPVGGGSSPARPTTWSSTSTPGEGATIVECCAVATLIAGQLDPGASTCLAKTSGSKGLQLYVPLGRRTTWDKVREEAHAMARTPRAVESRPGGLQHAQESPSGTRCSSTGARTIRPRPRWPPTRCGPGPRPTVSTPVTWEEVQRCADRGRSRPAPVHRRRRARPRGSSSATCSPRSETGAGAVPPGQDALRRGVGLALGAALVDRAARLAVGAPSPTLAVFLMGVVLASPRALLAAPEDDLAVPLGLHRIDAGAEDLHQVDHLGGGRRLLDAGDDLASRALGLDEDLDLLAVGVVVLVRIPLALHRLEQEVGHRQLAVAQLRRRPAGRGVPWSANGSHRRSTWSPA